MSCLAKEFGPTHLGKLIGIGFLSSAMVSILQAPLLDLVLGPLNGNFTWGNIILIASLLLMTPYALFLGRLCCARKQALLRRASRASRRSLRTPDLSAHKMPPSNRRTAGCGFSIGVRAFNLPYRKPYVDVCVLALLVGSACVIARNAQMWFHAMSCQHAHPAPAAPAYSCSDCGGRMTL